MPRTKSKKPRIDEEEEDIILPPEPLEPVEPVAPVRRADTGMILDLEGHGGEVASALIVNGLRAYLSVVNKGVNLVATNRAHTMFVPVKISACESGLDVKRDEVKPLIEANGVVAFLLENGEERTSYYFPAAEYLARAEDRGESGLRVDLDRDADWLNLHEGHAGVRRTFAKLLG